MPATTLNLTALQNRVLSFGYGEVDRSNATLWLNMAQSDIMTVRRWSWSTNTESVVTVPNTQTVTISSLADVPLYWGRLQPTDPTVAEPRFIDPMTYDDDWTRHAISSTTTGQPRAYTIWNGVITFYPIPDVAYTYTLWYWKAAVDLSGGTDTPPIPAQWENILVLGALVHAAERDRDQAAYVRRTNDYNRMLARMIASENELQAETPQRARMPLHYRGQYDRQQGSTAGTGWYG